MIELGGHSPKDVVVSYKMFRVITRVNGKLVPTANVSEDLVVEWLNGAVPDANGREAVDGFINDMESGCRNGQQQDCRRVASPTGGTTNDAVHEEFIELHVVTKNLQSIRNQTRFEDFMTELDGSDFDLLLLCETWGMEREEFFKTCGGNQLFLSGGSTHAGVGICVGRK